ncbi:MULTISPECIES: ABC transporter ATP-binding protein [Nonomuraea]|uniref:ABC-type glutathione transport system ATPase component n=3 Tax=Nonomuraea TaxID=83681 RepID=A0A7W5UV23_9ACTN|nr:ATP-binding cassette domain-containing protein [Nonomuraea dietziae]MBB3725172.1 ABC-type glutathione transport system ATPase component [Nonomuraea dietziae]
MIIKGLTVRFGAFTAVDDVTLEVPEGRIVGLVGESGSGKSTLARAVSGLVPYTGEIVDGDGVQMVFQDPYASLNPRMTVGASVAEGLRRPTPADVERLLGLVSLPPQLASRYPRELSGGMRQRVAIARALGASPRLLVADEITSALDVSVQGAVLNLVRGLRAELGLSMLFISHNLAVVRYVADEIAVMREGRVVEHGPTRQVVETPAHPYTRDLLAAVPRLPAP